MELYLSGSYTNTERQYLRDFGCLFLLNTYYDMRTWDKQNVLDLITIPKCAFMLDSGAFTFMNSGKEVHWKSYVDEYINFINKYDIKYFIELDLYGVLGVSKTEKIRKYIEHHTDKKPIPVYHGTMPVSYFRKLCEEYPYVAISATGTLESSKWTRNTKVLKQVIKIGHSYGTKLHGLGYTRMSNINNPDVLFDSIDSTSWLSGCRFGIWYNLRNNKIVKKNCSGMGITKDNFNKHNSKVWIDKQKDLYYNH